MALYDRYLERKRAASSDPEEEMRFLMALTAFEDAVLVQQTLDLTLGDDVRPQDRPFLLASLLARRPSRDAAWSFVRDRWDEMVRIMDPMLLQNLIRSLGHLTHEPVASEVREFLASKVDDETRETVSQVDERLHIDANTVRRLTSELEAVFGEEEA